MRSAEEYRETRWPPERVAAFRACQALGVPQRIMALMAGVSRKRLLDMLAKAESEEANDVERN